MKDGHAIWILWRATFWLSLLNVLLAPTSVTPPVDGSSKMVHIAWMAASAPAFKPAAVWRYPAASCMSSSSTQFLGLLITRLKTSLIPVGLYLEELV